MSALRIDCDAQTQSGCDVMRRDAVERRADGRGAAGPEKADPPYSVGIAVVCGGAAAVQYNSIYFYLCINYCDRKYRYPGKDPDDGRADHGADTDTEAVRDPPNRERTSRNPTRKI